MIRNRAFLLIATCCIAIALPAQNKKPSKQKPGKDAPAASKDDALTAKDKAIVAIDKFLQKHKVDSKDEAWRTKLTLPEKAVFDPAHDYYWHLLTTQGEITILLLPDSAPLHVTNYISLTRRGFYDGLVFHRVIQGFMAQGGSPLNTASGDPGYLFDVEIDPKQKHDAPGVLSTANSERPKTDGSQFFLTFAPAPHLDGKYTIAGRVTAGMEALNAIEANGSADNSGVPKAKMSITRAWVVVTEKPQGKAPEIAPEKPPAKPPGKAGGN